MCFTGFGRATLKAKLLQHLMAMRELVLFELFLDLQKAYYALDQDRCLGIFTAYGVGPRTIRLLWIYWDRLTMVVRAGGYFGLPFKGYRGMTQGDHLSCCGRCHLKLGGGGGSNQGGHGGNWPVDTGLGGVFICQQRPCCFDPTREATECVRCSHWPL